MNATGSVHSQQLLELLAVLSSYADQDSAVQGAVERAAQAFEAEVAAVVVDDQVLASIGFPAGTVPHLDIIAIARCERDRIDVPGAGPCHALSAGWGRTRLVLARRDDDFSVEERGVVRGMARLLELTLTMLRALQTEHAMRRRSERQAARNAELLTSLRERQRLLEHLFDIQRAISRRRPLDQILHRVTDAARDLLGADVVGLWLRESADTDQISLVAHIGLDADLTLNRYTVPLAAAGAVGAAILDDRLVVHDGGHPMIVPLTEGKLGSAMTAPVHDSGTVTGSLLVGTYQADRFYTASEIQTLHAFAENVSLALTDANTVDRMHQAFHDSLTGLASRGLFL
ncbi:MAG TPA: GAF domain-containing protein, partial [Amycolatopsis sp.]|nr:GAF domain-containing protein [Amycolatopsis sp.]